MSAYPHYCPFNLVWIKAKQVKPTVHLRKLAQQANKKSLKRTAKAINYFSSLLIFQPMCIKKTPLTTSMHRLRSTKAQFIIN